MAIKPKKHHYVPRSVLVRFSIEGEGKQVYVFDKLEDRAWPSSINDAGAENHFNTIEVHGERTSFETAFQDVDQSLAVLLDRITRERSLAGLSAKDRGDLADVIAVQLVRTKLVRATMLATMKALEESVASAGLNPDQIANFHMPTDQDVRRAALAMFMERDAFRDALVAKCPVLLEAGEDASFWTSDNPVQMFNSFPYGESALSAPGVEIYCPISPTLSLGFYCPSIGRKISEILQLPQQELAPDLRQRYSSLRDAMASGKPTRLSASTPNFLNELQVRRSSRFLYAASDDFTFARGLLARDAGLRQIESFGTVGPMGSGPPPKPRMPTGLWLVLYGQKDHFMLEISDWNKNSRFIEVSTPDLAALTAALRDQPLQQAILFQDGAERRGMRKIKIEVVGQSNTAEVRIVHSDDGLNAVLAQKGRGGQRR